MMFKSFQIWNLLNIFLLLSITQITYSVPNQNWTFWNYSNNGQNKSCANYCILTFSIIGFVILLLIIFAILIYYRKKKSLEIRRSDSMSEVYTGY
ncbi:hypothetical protein GLOIN_2v1665703 [Rhizophagus irregularis DAOM 181602=DAOM 197198]|uniref:Uncharacterized protein n=1 Tax=Rhizophagus irregularis (strain DAOM 181602 / DAOM 197198 / MUCL 43194) TaxID=747089 RepID=A0A2P4PJC2_RHIID|nr:hypothetical protein GLOIN_2v1665703 [Rhizophagus irregularis DAOM 181602=DAOM 197198]POG65492.1 hypothetical protein GLOIN_2v1665703 [Rhizophagus irregularis DAOM 181602=DAOM 197198]GET60588.1 hypothetical protein GLOIN_2v1665703 [Rhizophagus irregularis DAOM 181602=DAOM 197198]|eukprot:XP_025172358.1 hypothetical protein GLOIN_2v1665703 [Rhizophagus irregularis DAOM 181602=DAOM 197198]